MAAPITVVVTAPSMGPDLGYLSDIDDRLVVVDGIGAPPEARDDLLAQADVLVLGYPVPRQVVARSPKVQWVHHPQAGVSNFHRSDLWSSDVVLTSGRGTVAATGIAEFALAAAFHFGRGLNEAWRQKQAGEFTRDGYAMQTLTGSTMGVVGYGGIGRELGRLARAVGMRVVATRRTVTERRHDVDGADVLLPADGLLELAAESDYVAICSQLTEETRGMIDASVFAAMKPSAVLINVARGEEVDEDALVAALTEGRIAGAVLDVHHGELDGHPPRAELVELPQVLLAPHISGMGDLVDNGAGRRLLVENLRRYLDGRPLLNLVDRTIGY